jgi:hypothetical protein
MQRLFTCWLILVCLTGSRAVPQQVRLPKELFGAWRLSSVEGQPPGLPDFYDHPTGLIIYDPSGRMSVQIANKRIRKPFSGGFAAGTIEERAGAFDSYFGYYGTYTFDAATGKVTHHIEDYSYPDLRGRDQVRWVEFQGSDRIVLIPLEDGKGGVIARKDATYKLVWERAR